MENIAPQGRKGSRMNSNENQSGTATMQRIKGRAVAFTGELPKKIGVGGGGGRKSEFLDDVRAALSQGNEWQEPVVVGEGETFQDAAKRTTGKLYRKGAIHDPNDKSKLIDFSVRTVPPDQTADGQGYVRILPVVGGATQGNQNGTAAAAQTPASAGIPTHNVNVQLPTPAAGQELEVTIPGSGTVVVRHRNPEPTVQAPTNTGGRAATPAKRSPGRPKGSGKR
jgi:hypothetical protein